MCVADEATDSSDENITDNYDIVSILVYNSECFDIRYDGVSNGLLIENCTFESNIVRLYLFDNYNNNNL